MRVVSSPSCVARSRCRRGLSARRAGASGGSRARSPRWRERGAAVAAGGGASLVLHGERRSSAPRDASRGARCCCSRLRRLAPPGSGSRPMRRPRPRRPRCRGRVGQPAAAGRPGVAPPREFELLRARLSRRGPPRAPCRGERTAASRVPVGANGLLAVAVPRRGAAADAFAGIVGRHVDFLAAGRGDARAAVSRRPDRARRRAGALAATRPRLGGRGGRHPSRRRGRRGGGETTRARAVRRPRRAGDLAAPLARR